VHSLYIKDGTLAAAATADLEKIHGDVVCWTIFSVPSWRLRKEADMVPEE